MTSIASSPHPQDCVVRSGAASTRPAARRSEAAPSSESVVDTMLRHLRGGLFNQAAFELRRGGSENKYVPWYDRVVRPMNRALQGPAQPLSSSVGAVTWNAYWLHDFVGGIIKAAVCRRGLDLRPHPFFITALALVGAVVGLHKVGRFYHEQAFHRVTQEIMVGDVVLGRQLAKFANRLLRAPQSGMAVKALGAFLEKHRNQLAPGAQSLVSRLLEQDAEAVEEVGTLIKLGQAYEHSKTNQAFAAFVDALKLRTGVEAVTTPTREDHRMLALDGAKSALFGLGYGIMWTQWADRYRAGDPAAHDEVLPGVLTLGAVAVALYLAHTEVDVNKHRCGDRLISTAAGRRVAASFAKDIDVSPMDLLKDGMS